VADTKANQQKSSKPKSAAVGETQVSAHTPGPWKLDSYLGGFKITAVDPEYPQYEFRLCDIGGEDSANAHLIAAAPELLEALKAIQKHAEWIQSPSLEKTIRVLCAEAIAKAEGRA
jgi:hypothetical protein